MKRWIGCAAVVCTLAWPAISEASNIGISVDGHLAFQFGPNTNLFTPTTAVVAEPLVEFGYHAVDPDADGLGVVTTDATANFTAQQLIVTYSIIGDADQVSSWTMTFTSAAFANLMLSEVSDTLGVTGSLEGNQLKVIWPALTGGSGLPVPTAVFDFSARAVPEPASLLLLVTGLGAALLYGRRARS